LTAHSTPATLLRRTNLDTQGGLDFLSVRRGFFDTAASSNDGGGARVARDDLQASVQHLSPRPCTGASAFGPDALSFPPGPMPAAGRATLVCFSNSL
jgi:hypothetical protein